MRIRATLGVKSINNAIEQIRKYKEQLGDKNELFVKRLCEIGIPVVEEYVNMGSKKVIRYTKDGTQVIEGSDTDHYTHINLKIGAGGIEKAELVVDGSDIAFIEFGAGVHYNAKPSPNPRGKALGLTIGSYGMGQGNNDSWVYIEENGDTVITHGTRATMPLYRAELEIIRQVEQIAREVFGT